MISIKYGIGNILLDVTDLVLKYCVKGEFYVIPKGDNNRALIFTDPIVNVKKLIYIDDAVYDDSNPVYINMKTLEHSQDSTLSNEMQKATQKLYKLWGSLKISHGDFTVEVPEQIMSLRFIKGTETILEIGGNIGRNSLIISSILNETKLITGTCGSLTTLESDPTTTKQLEDNRNANNFDFRIIGKALSQRPLIQNGWSTKIQEGDVIESGYFKVNTITWSELSQVASFDTLVLDCEGAFYYILQDTPEILNGITKIIMENDYTNYDHKIFVDTTLQSKGFTLIYNEEGGWPPCTKEFYQVWTR